MLGAEGSRDPFILRNCDAIQHHVMKWRQGYDTTNRLYYELGTVVYSELWQRGFSPTLYVGGTVAEPDDWTDMS